MAFRFNRSEVSLPPLQLRHVEASLSFGEVFVDGAETLTLQARQAVERVELDAKELEIFEVSLPGLAEKVTYEVDSKRNKLVINLPRKIEIGGELKISIRCRCRPSETILDGLYRDTTPPGAPQQYMSQCQQWGFQRILPIIDDCTAKCTFRTTLEGDSRYTHMISNGDVDRSVNPDGKPVPKPGDPSRQVITYVNRLPMAPYLFLVCAGTWDELSDSVTYPNGKRIALSYLVPKGKLDGAKLPMEILKKSILWQHEKLGYVYPYETYRTISMEKSNYGGMENTGNTTIITEAALIDPTTGDRRLIYAHGVIVHEYEHNHCGSGVTMASPFDMWLNEAYTVDTERQFVASVFDPDFIRLHEIDALRSPGDGPLATEDTGKAFPIVREGFDDPDEVVDGITYEKAPEVLNMLRQLLGPEKYRQATDLYFSRYMGGNADTDQFIACFEEVAGHSLAPFTREWLFTPGYPRVQASYSYDEETRKLTLSLKQSRKSPGGPFVLPFPVAAVNARGEDILNETVKLDRPEMEITFPDLDRPAFLSLNRRAGFYGICEDLSATTDQLSLQIRLDPDPVNRVEAMRRLTDLERRRLLEDPSATPSEAWSSLYAELAADNRTPDGIRGYLLTVDELPSDRSLLPRVRELPLLRKALLKAASAKIPLPLYEEILFSDRELPLPQAIERRSLKNALLQLLTLSPLPEAYTLLDRHLAASTSITDRLNTLTAIWQSEHPRRREILEEAGRELRTTLGGKLGFLQVIGQTAREELFEAVEKEASRPDFDWSHPGMLRALFVPVVQNNSQIWTPKGLAWIEDLLVKLAPMNEYTTLRLLAPTLGFRAFAPDLGEAVRAMLERCRSRLDTRPCPWVKSRLDNALA